MKAEVHHVPLPVARRPVRVSGIRSVRGRRGKAPGRKRSVEDRADPDQEAWTKHLKKLGSPIYRVEVLYHEPETNRFFLCQTLLSATVKRANSMFGVGLGDFN